MRCHFDLVLKSLLFVLLCVFQFSFQANAQSKSTLRVLVTSQGEGTPIMGANVILRAPETERDKYKIIDAGVTDKDGFQEFRDVPAGAYQLQVSFVGYGKYQKEIHLGEGQIRVEQVELSMDVEQLEEVVVESEREVTTGDVGLRRISSRDLGRVPTAGPTGDLTSYLQTLPGVVTTGDRGGGLFIRGGTPEQNKVLVDNLPVIKPFHISNLFSAFPEENIQNVDMYAGGFGAEYMGATSAVIDATLKAGNMRRYTGSASLGSHLLSLRMEGPLKTDRESFFISGRKSLIGLTSPYLSSKENDLEFYDITGRYSYQSEDFYCNVTGMHTYDRGQINPNQGIMLSWSNTVLGGRCRGFDERYNHPFVVTAGYSQYNNSEGSANHNERISSLQKMYIKVDLEEDIWGLPFEYGFGMKYRTASAKFDEKFVQLKSFENLNLIPYGYISTVIELNKYFTLRPSIGTQVTWGTATTLEPRFRMAFYPDGSNRQEISIALGRYTQDINGITDERDAGTTFTFWKPVESGDPIQSAYHAILNYRQRIGEGLTTNIEGYIKDHRNISVSKWTPEAGLKTETSFANGMAYGFDVRLEYEKFPVYFYLGYGWSKTKYEAASGNLGAWIEEPVFKYFPPHDQRHKFNSMMSYNFAGFTASISWEFGTGKPYTKVYGFDLSLDSPTDNPLQDPGTARTLYSRPYSERFPTYHRLDASIERSFEISSQLSVKAKAGCMNIYDRQNIFYYDLNALQRVNQTPLLPYFSIKTEIN